MSQSLTFARPYARAAFSIAHEQGRLPAWSQLLGFSATAVSDPTMKPVIGHPRVAPEQLVELLLPLGEVDPTYRQFLAVLAANRRLALLPEVAALYAQHRAEAERIVKATVTSAQPLEPVEVEALRISLRKRLGRDVELATAVDPALIGGAVIDAGDVVIDGSIRTKLARLGAALAH
jgi:F-type H+-transporting ATPase subunit delta